VPIKRFFPKSVMVWWNNRRELRSSDAIADELLHFLKQHSVIRAGKEAIVLTTGKPATWLIDTRIALLNPRMAHNIAALMWEKAEVLLPFQLSCMEMTGIPLMVTIQAYALSMGHKVNGVIIRRERKSHGRQRQIEGELNELPIVHVDDILNSGASIKRAAGALSVCDRTISHVIALIDYRVNGVKEALAMENIQTHFVFSLDALGLRKGATDKGFHPELFERVWNYSTDRSLVSDTVPKSNPVCDESLVYFCSDSGECAALRQADGCLVWKFKVGAYGPKYLWSTPSLYEGHIFISGYDGNLYCLTKHAGELVWTFEGADWIGSSPCVVPELGGVTVGLEHALPGKRGSIVLMDSATGAKRWEMYTSEYMHGSPLYISEPSMVVVGANDGFLYAFDGNCGRQMWAVATGGPIKSRPEYDPASHQIVVGSFDKHVYAIDSRSGQVRWRTATRGSIYSEPLIVDNEIYIASTDKSLYILERETGTLKTRLDVGAKLYSSPSSHLGRIYFASTAGIVYEYDPIKGQLTGQSQLPERVTNKVAYGENSRLFFAATLDGKLFALRRL
jgi:outer membrane protein assembly factor BamB/orotate phosphoribosyltransferase